MTSHKLGKHSLLTVTHKVLNTVKRFVQRRLNLATLGVRAIVVNEKGRVLLVKHTYSRGWYLPGGGVDAGEHPNVAICRELKEETGVIVSGDPRLLGIFCHRVDDANDYPFLYEVKDFSIVANSSVEIAQQEWFQYPNLPTDVTPATRRRLQEYFSGEGFATNW